MSVLDNKVVVVIGASSGIGAEMSKYFSKNGAKTVAVARRKERLQVISDELTANGFSYTYYVGDATDFKFVNSMADDVIEKYGKIDAWINCAGQNKAIGKFWEIDEQSLWDEVEVDLKSAMNGTKIAINRMKDKNSGVILNFCGGGAAKPHVYAAAYSTAKAAIARLTESVYLELVEDNINIKIFCTNPGLVHNERTQLLCDGEVGQKYMPSVGTAFANGKGQSPINPARLVEYALDGQLDNYNGKLIMSFALEKLIKEKDTHKDTQWGFLRLCNDDKAIF